uniref:Uncharacterized protein n=1 Tax=Zea mays TaxID=4577 RepID=A0A804PT62_MAIZE
MTWMCGPQAVLRELKGRRHAGSTTMLGRRHDEIEIASRGWQQMRDSRWLSRRTTWHITSRTRRTRTTSRNPRAAARPPPRGLLSHSILGGLLLK